MEKMLVTQALNELKTLNARITREIQNAKFVAAAKNIEKNVVSNLSKVDFCNNAKSTMQSIEDLIERSKRIKEGIVHSNAITNVEINGVVMTRAAAIERKTSIEYEKELLKVMKDQYNNAMALVNRKNAEMEVNIDRLVTQTYSKEGKANIKPDDYASIANPYRENNEYGLVDPLNLYDEIVKRSNEIDAFLSQVDSVLQISNCTTFIEF